MTDLEYQERIARMTVPELIESIARLTEDYSRHLTILTHEILIREMQNSN